MIFHSLVFFLNTIFITPAIASDPYCAEAPSLKISILSTADCGNPFKSTPELPRPLVPNKPTKAVLCLRFPFTKTKVWSGPKPRKVPISI